MPDPSDVVDRLQMYRTLTNAVLDLPEPYRSVVVARYLDQGSVAGIARRRGTSEAAVRQQLGRATARLRRRLAKTRGRDWRTGLALLVAGGDRASPPRTFPDNGPGANPAPVAAPAAVLATMKSILTVLLTATAAVLLWQLWPAVPDPLFDDRAAGAPGADEEHSALPASAAERSGTPSGDARSEVPAARASGSFVLGVVDHAGNPIPEVTVVLAPDRPGLVPGDLERKVTDGDGRVELETVRPDGDGAGPHRLLLTADSRVPQWVPFEVPGAGAERTWRYGGPGTVRGVVTTVGDPAALGSEVEARPRRLRLPRHDLVLRDVPQAVTGEFAHRGLLHMLRGTATVDPGSGAFVFHGLPESRPTLRVALPHYAPFLVHPEHTVAESADRRSATLRVGRTDHVVAVVPIPAVRLRAVFEDGAPAVGATAEMRPWLVDDDGPMTFMQADANGTFLFGMDLESIPLHRYLDPGGQPRVMRVDVHEINHPGAESHPEFTFEMPPGVRWADAGEVVLRRLAEVHVRALDHNGAPVRGAVFEGTRRSAPTGTDGCTIVRTEDEERRAFRIGAPGMLVDRYEAVGGSGTGADPLRFELARENRVELRLVSDVLEADDVSLVIDGPEDLFHAADERFGYVPSHLHRAAGIGRFSSGGKRWRTAGFAEDLTFALVSIVPGARITATVSDRGGAVIAEHEFVMPRFGESERVRLEPDAPICRVDGRVLTAAGTPAEARLTVGESRKHQGSIHRARAWTGDDGRFRLRLVASGKEVPVRVEGDGHALLRDRLRLVEGAVEPVFRLRAGHTVTACLVGHEGRMLDTEVGVADRGLGASCERLPDGTTRITRLPDGEVTLRASYAGRTFEERIDPVRVSGRVAIHAPEPERIPLRVAPHVAEDTVLTLAIFRVADDGDRIHLQVHCVDGTWQPDELPIYPGRYRVRCGAYATGNDEETTWTITEGDTGPRWLMRGQGGGR